MSTTCFPTLLLSLFQGNRDVISALAPGSRRVLDDVLHLIDTYDLYGLVSKCVRLQMCGVRKCGPRQQACRQNAPHPIDTCDMYGLLSVCVDV